MCVGPGVQVMFQSLLPAACILELVSYAYELLQVCTCLFENAVDQIPVVGCWI